MERLADERLAAACGETRVAMVPANPLKPPARVKIPRQEPMERRAAELRRTDFEEVSQGFTEERALLEALRCLECRDPGLHERLPRQRSTSGASSAASSRRTTRGALSTIRETNSLPAICGRVCPQESQCEEVCTLGKKFAPVAIGKLERFVADYEDEHDGFVAAGAADASRHGAWPSWARARRASPARRSWPGSGYGVTVFEALHAVGGVLRYGIPEFRLPKEHRGRRRPTASGPSASRSHQLRGRPDRDVDELFGELGLRRGVPRHRRRARPRSWGSRARGCRACTRPTSS